jgi:nickel/cobalt transporter (NicO) family protein
MVLAIGLNQMMLGLGLIVSFSLGLAAVLILIGILLVHARSLIERFSGQSARWSKTLPVVSALIILLLGLGVALSGVMAYVQ